MQLSIVLVARADLLQLIARFHVADAGIAAGDDGRADHWPGIAEIF